jgi:hypothetical protein
MLSAPTLLFGNLKLRIGEGTPEEHHELQLVTLGPHCTSSPYVKIGSANKNRTEQRETFASVKPNKRKLKTYGMFWIERLFTSIMRATSTPLNMLDFLCVCVCVWRLKLLQCCEYGDCLCCF